MSKKITQYLDMLNQKQEIVFTEEDNVSSDSNVNIYKFVFNDATRYYIQLSYLLTEFCGLAKSGAIKTERFKNNIFFPHLIYAKDYTGDSRNHFNFYIELSKEAFLKIGQRRIRKNPDILIDLKNKIKMTDLADAIKVNDIAQPTEQPKNVITGQMPLNYGELIASLNLRENYGKKLSTEIENCITYVLQNAEYEVKTPEIPEQYKTCYDFVNSLIDQVGNIQKAINSDSLYVSTEEDVRAEMDAIEYDNYQQNLQEEEILEKLQAIPVENVTEVKESNIDPLSINLSYDDLSTFISNMQRSAWANEGNVDRYTNSVYITVCEMLGVNYTNDWKLEHEGTQDDPYWYCFRDHKVLCLLAKFYISNGGIKSNKFYSKDKISGVRTPFSELICNSYDAILNNNIRTFLLKPLGLPTDNGAVESMKRCIMIKSDQEFRSFKK